VIKRSIDVVVAAAGLALLSPVLAAVALLVRWRLGTPVVFRQDRLGRHEQPFRMLKFRTMTDACGPSGALLPDADRLIPLGRVLRASSLDELPQLWNVLRGDMSLVGPRPLPVEYGDRFRPEERPRHDVRPGITGWAQVSGRNTVGWDERLAADVWYVQHRSLWLDARILARTVGAVAQRRGITAEGEATMDVLRPGRLDADGGP
jgi:lipopolysaccharide/colanic/teichoic acid biosynthesis glycosyltransferase